MTFKRGSTFTATVVYIPSASDPADLSSVTVTSSINVDGTEYIGTVTKAVDNMSFTVVHTAAVTATFTLGGAEWDAKFVYSSTTFYSATEGFLITDNITT